MAIKTREQIQEVRAMASRMEELGLPKKIVDKIRSWVKGEGRRLRDEAR